MAKPPRQAAWVDQLGRWIRPPKPVAGAAGRRAVPLRRLALGLQGGGALGAFTWGVLDRLLEEPGLPLSAVSGASAGAVNGAVLVSHWTRGGPTAARHGLERLWRRLSEQASLTRPGWLPGLGQSAGAVALDVTLRLFSPYQLNPLDLNPLREILADEVDFPTLGAPEAPELIVAATRVRDGTPRLFRRGAVTLDVVIASACLPLIHQAVEIEGEVYWDGGYTSNPPLRPLVADPPPDNLLVVQLNPADYGGLPKTSREITHRLNQILFNRPLMEEWAALEPEAAAGRFRLDRLVIDPETMPAGGALDLDWAFLTALKEQGRTQAAAWLASGALSPEGAGSPEREPS
jgi:NTE family protein